MKPIRNVLAATLLSAGAVLTAVCRHVDRRCGRCRDDHCAAARAPGAHGWHHHGGPWHLLGKLDLSDAQKQRSRTS